MRLIHHMHSSFALLNTEHVSGGSQAQLTLYQLVLTNLSSITCALHFISCFWILLCVYIYISYCKWVSYITWLSPIDFLVMLIACVLAKHNMQTRGTQITLHSCDRVLLKSTWNTCHTTEVGVYGSCKRIGWSGTTPKQVLIKSIKEVWIAEGRPCTSIRTDDHCRCMR